MTDKDALFVGTGEEFRIGAPGTTLNLAPSAGKICLTFRGDGNIEIGEGLTPDEAGRQAIDAMQHQLDFIRAKDKARIAELERALRFVEPYLPRVVTIDGPQAADPREVIAAALKETPDGR
jgi:hypothetical protein